MKGHTTFILAVKEGDLLEEGNLKEKYDLEWADIKNEEDLEEEGDNNSTLTPTSIGGSPGLSLNHHAGDEGSLEVVLR
jgi:hypothetical protein